MVTRLFVLAAVLIVSFADVALSSDGSGMKVSASVDIVGSQKVNDASPAPDRIDIREAEIVFYGPADHLFEGMLSLAAHREDGVSMFEVHEATVSSSKLIPRSKFRLGQYFVGVGRLNRFHRHEWPFISPPKVQAEFFDEEGILDTGLEYSFVAPLPFYLDVTAGITNGWVYGHAHDEGEKPEAPLHYARVGTYFELPSSGGAQLGFNYLGRKADDGEAMTLIGMDGVAKWRSGAVLDFLLQSEIWYRIKKPKGADAEKSLGLYVLPQMAMTESFYLGLRLDYFSILSLENLTGSSISNANYAVVPTLTYKPSEFSAFRAAYTYGSDHQENLATIDRQTFEIQATFMLGAHPAHDF